MEKALYVLMLSFLIAKPAIAQTDQPGREIGISTQFIFNNSYESTAGPASFMYKKQSTDNTWKRYSLTFNVGFGGDKAKSNTDCETSYFSTNFSPGVGFEKRNQIAEKWQLLWGGDIYAYVNYSKQKNTSSQSGGNNSDQKNLGVGAGLRPFLGILFQISPRFYASTEAFANLAAGLGKRKTVSTQNQQTTTSKWDSWNGSANIRPASAIFLYYRF